MTIRSDGPSRGTCRKALSPLHSQVTGRRQGTPAPAPRELRRYGPGYAQQQKLSRTRRGSSEQALDALNASHWTTGTRSEAWLHDLLCEAGLRHASQRRHALHDLRLWGVLSRPSAPGPAGRSARLR